MPGLRISFHVPRNVPAMPPIEDPLTDSPSETVISESELLTRTVLFAHVTPDAPTRAMSSDELAHATERCLKRMRRAAEAFGGRKVRAGPDAALALFVDADAALQAACEIKQRVDDVPPLAGVKLACRIGLDTGSLVADGSDAYGECIDNAAMIAGLAAPGQIVASATAAHALSPELGRLAHAIVLNAPPGKPNPGPVLEFLCAEIIECTSKPAQPARKTAALRLILSLGNDSTTVTAGRNVRTIGRDIGNDLAVTEPRASRTHARVEMRGENFVLIDVSRNGTFVRLASGRQFVLRKAEMELPEQGLISLGRPCAPDAPCISFEIVRR